MIDHLDNAGEPADDRDAVFSRLFALAVRRAGSPSALARSLGLTPSEVERYATGDATPPNDIILRTVDWILEHYVAKSWSEQALRYVLRSSQALNNR